MLREVRPTLRISAKRLTSSPTNTGEWNTMLSAATVAQRPRARRAAALPAARSICAISQPPKISPAGLVSAGIAMVRIAGADAGGVGRGGAPAGESSIPVTAPRPALPSRHEAALRGLGAGVHVAAAVQMVVRLRRATEHPRVEEDGEGCRLQRLLREGAGAIGPPQHLQEQRRDHRVDVDA